MAKEMTHAQALGEIAKGGEVLVDVWATWCGPCKQMAPIIDRFATANPDINVIKVDADHVAEGADKNDGQEFDVSSIPTLILFKDGVEVKRHTGALAPGPLKKFVTE